MTKGRPCWDYLQANRRFSQRGSSLSIVPSCRTHAPSDRIIVSFHSGIVTPQRSALHLQNAFLLDRWHELRAQLFGPMHAARPVTNTRQPPKHERVTRANVACNGRGLATLNLAPPLRRILCRPDAAHRYFADRTHVVLATAFEHTKLGDAVLCAHYWRDLVAIYVIFVERLHQVQS